MPTGDFFPDQTPDFEDIKVAPPPKKKSMIGKVIGGFFGNIFGYKPDTEVFQDVLAESEAQRKASERQQFILYGFIFLILIASIFAVVKITKK